MDKIPLGLGNPILMPLNLNSAWIILRRILNRSLRSCLFLGIRYLVFFPHFRRMSWKHPNRKRWSKVLRPKWRGAKKRLILVPKLMQSFQSKLTYDHIFNGIPSTQGKGVILWLQASVLPWQFGANWTSMGGTGFSHFIDYSSITHRKIPIKVDRDSVLPLQRLEGANGMSKTLIFVFDVGQNKQNFYFNCKSEVIIFDHDTVCKKSTFCP